VRVHPDILDRQLPASCRSRRIWTERLDDIANFEQYLTRQGTIILEVCLYLSRGEKESCRPYAWRWLASAEVDRARAGPKRATASWQPFFAAFQVVRCSKNVPPKVPPRDDFAC
jgi:hypothetical protein